MQNCFPCDGDGLEFICRADGPELLLRLLVQRVHPQPSAFIVARLSPQGKPQVSEYLSPLSLFDDSLAHGAVYLDQLDRYKFAFCAGPGKSLNVCS